jgi:hypothetical protein
LPILFFLGKSGWRLGQAIIFLLFSYLSLSFFVVWLFEKFSQSTTMPQQFSRFVLYTTMALLILLQTFIEYKYDLSYKLFLKNSFIYNFAIRGEQKRRISNYFDNKQLAQSIDKLREVITSDANILVDWYYSARATYFKMKGERQVSNMPFIWCSAKGFVIGEPPNSLKEKPIFITSNNKPLERQFYLFMLFESQLIQKIKEKNIKYILLTRGFWQLHQYFSASPFFNEIFVTGPTNKPHKMCRIYRVVPSEKSDTNRTPIISDTLKKNLRILMKNKPRTYELFLNKYITGLASFTTSDLEKFNIAK